MLIKDKYLYKPSTHLILYVLLLIATPFLMLQNYLQSFIGNLSVFPVRLFSFSIPLIPSMVFLMLFVLAVIKIKKFTRNRIAGWAIIFMMFLIGQKVTDFYFNHNFYDLQYNWHYFAYGIFAWLIYRHYHSKNSPPEKIMLFAFLLTLAVSTFDEAVQVPLSNRIFDFGDIAKDLWGALIGLVLIFMVLENGKVLSTYNTLRQPGFQDYLKHPVSLFFLMLVFTFIFMFVSSNTSDSKYWFQTIFISLLIFAVFILIYHFSQSRRNMLVIMVLGSLLLGLQLFYFLRHRNENIVHTSENLVVYKGIPVYFFDLMIFPDGNFRIVDKKKYFNKRDLNTILHIAENILIVGNGNDKPGNAGLISKPPVQFVYNTIKKKGLQVVVLDNKSASTIFNRLKKEGKRPVLIMHNNSERE